MTNLSLAGFTASQHSIFNQAESYWESILTGYQPGVSIPILDIDAVSEQKDGEGGILGSAGPTTWVNMGGFFLATNGIIKFDRNKKKNQQIPIPFTEFCYSLL
jgi:hypothetical protein